ncbi:MAG: peroxiredoxin [Nanohaloarchaea archaeon SW_10_44_10]|nr:MAG: peroxiredoxin [Nanohaloarchaea archaeon SW_10_44_10]
MIREGDSVPKFEVKNQDGEKVVSEKIEDAVIYFYPKADTPGCTKEACSFRDNINRLEDKKLEVYGASTDSVEAQKKFAEKYNLNFDLLADQDGNVAGKFGVLQESGYAERTTFILRNGDIEKVFRKVDPEEHSDEVIRYLRMNRK